MLRSYLAFAVLTTLVACVDERTPPSRQGAHPEGWAVVDSPAFHGTFLRENGDDLTRCLACHGPDPQGGPVGVTCAGTGCHERPDGPEACGTCHGDHGDDPLPTTGAHAVHRVYCESCHTVPRAVGDAGHLDDGTPGGDVRFTGLALADGATPTFDLSTKRCNDTHCHVDGAPAWTDPGPLGCDGCHSAPPATHARFEYVAATETQCATCHPAVPGDHHVDGVRDLTLPDGCDTCHGDGEEGTVFVGLDGQSDPARRGAGAHERHVDAAAPNRVSAPLACETCHVVPTAEGVLDVGHLDAEPPADVALPDDGAWDPVAATCVVTCHGGPDRTSPAWTEDSGDPSCAGCHGDPPESHAPWAARITAGQCEDCHPTPPAEIDRHLDGEAQIAFAAGCATCHGELDPAVPFEGVAGAAGAHDAHLESTLGRPVPCTTCHAVPADFYAAGHADGLPAEITLANGGTYDPATQTCSTWCHGGPARTSPPWTDTIEGCDTCHGNPPDEHVAWGFGDVVYNCSNCHTVPPGPTHIDGEVTGP